MWNGVYAAARQKMRWVRARRKALIVLSDGLDTGSLHGLEDAIEPAQEAETVVYAIKYVDPTVASGGSRASARRNRGLERLTDKTGGYTFPDPQETGCPKSSRGLKIISGAFTCSASRRRRTRATAGSTSSRSRWRARTLRSTHATATTLNPGDAPAGRLYGQILGPIVSL